jgi:hypothetical protein
VTFDHLSDDREDKPSAVAETEFQWHLRHLKRLLENAKAELQPREWDALRDILLRQLGAGQ